MDTSVQPYSRAAALLAIEAARKAGQRIIFTSGAFDLLHAGHVSYLNYAKQLGGFLVVGVNSDTSVATYKDPRRPISPQASRCAVIAGLRAVDCVFVFEEPNNNENVKAIKPDIYLKAGDYSAEKLSSAELVAAYCGSIVIAPLQPGLSSSGFVDTVLARYGDEAQALTSASRGAPCPAVFIDRDGTINGFVEYLSEPEKFKFIPRAIEGLLLLQKQGFRLVITTNQPGIGLGYFTREDFFKVNRVMLKELSAASLKIDKVYFCPDSYAIQSEYRKPATGMIQRGVKELNIDLLNSYVVGDMTIDIEFASRAGCRSVLVKTGKAGLDKSFDVRPDFVAEDLYEAAVQIGADYAKRHPELKN